jgi:hypothetical protein
MMRFILLVLLHLPLWVFGQAAQGRVAARIAEARSSAVFAPVRLFEAEPRNTAQDALWRDALRDCQVLRYDMQAAAALLGQRAAHIALELPFPEGPAVVDLERVEITADGFQVRVSSEGGAVEAPPGLHYRGIIRGVEGAVAAVSIFEKEVMAIIGDARGDRVIGRFANDAEGLHACYWEHDLRGTFMGACGTADLPLPDAVEPRGDGGAKTVRCVTIYWEAAYDLFLNKGSVANVTSYLTGLFNQMATLFANDGVNVVLQEIFVWNTASPYNATTSSGKLNQFGQVRTSFNGNLAHLIDLGGTGGIAWLNTLCSSTNYRMAYSGINSSYSNVPTYSWSVEVVTHETGHNLGSSHTHACVWNGNNTAIDGCGQSAGYSEGSCPQGPLPPSSVGGTIMSYCHLTSSTIKFANGFGPQPAELIRLRVNTATCLASCGTTCDAPIPLNVPILNATSATLSWSNYGAVSYTLRWKPTSSGTWTTVTGLTGTSYPLTGLSQNVEYEFQVLSVCGSGSSPYSASRVFTTPVPCTDAYEPNNSTGAATLVTLPAAINALIGTSSDADYFRFTLSATSTIFIGLSNLAGDYDVRLLDGSGTQITISQAGGTTSESITYASAAAGNYFVHVYGYNGAFSTVQCYLLTINASATACNAPQGLQASSITWNSASISWVAQPGGGSTWDLRWKPTSSSTWTTVTGLTASPYALTGLAPLTSYDVQVRAVCGGVQGSTSAWTNTVSFTTLEAPCEVVPRSVVSAKVFLEGAYRSALGLMIDSLRRRNLIPLTEPYTAMGHALAGPTTITPGVLAITGADAIVDWVLVELRQSSSPFTVIEARAALVQCDGDVVAPDGTSPLGFCANAGTYRVAMRHRNHLGVMSGAGIALGASPTVVNLTVSGTPAYGTNARKAIGAVQALWAGNVNANAELKYTGEGNDRDPILTGVGGSVPTNTVTAYSGADVNMDGTIKYTGQDNDRDPILTNVGGSVPTNTLPEQLP